MHRFRVWAPKAQTVAVSLVRSGETHPLAKVGEGWWQADVAAAGPGTDYAYLLDDDPLQLPDPRSAWLPEGVHGPSRLVDHAAFSWTDAGFRPAPFDKAVIYELHVGTFTPEGTFDGAIEKLAYLKELGITHVELLPVNAFPGRHNWGYDGVGLYAPQESYGGPDGLKRLVDACHRHGLAAILDVVYNHFGPDGNYLGRFGPYFTDAHKTPWGDAVNLEDAGSHEVRNFFCDNALMWLRDYHFDGLRLDAVHAYMDRSAVNFMEQLTAEVRALEAATRREYVVIAESDLNDPRLIEPVEKGGYAMDAAWSDDFHHALVTVLTGERIGYYRDFGTMADLAKALEDGYVYDWRYSPHRDRMHGRPLPKDVPGWRLLGFAQNHDQVGNRANGERLSHLVSTGRAKIAAALVLLAPFTPMLFQGEEWGTSAPFQFFTDHEPELGKLVSEGRKREFAAFGWPPDEVPDPQELSTFERSRLPWKELEEPCHAEILEWHRQLIGLRARTPALTDGDLRAVHADFNEEARWLILRRGPIEVVVNLGAEPLQTKAAQGARLELASEAAVRLEDRDLTVPPDGVAILIAG
jgi:maltooligosyltrehalose trehalohydrolase